MKKNIFIFIFILFELFFLNNSIFAQVSSNEDPNTFIIEYQSQWTTVEINFNKNSINKIVKFLNSDKENNIVKIELFYEDERTAKLAQKRANKFYKHLNKAGYYGKMYDNRQLLIDFYGIDSKREYKMLFIGLIYLIEE